MKHFGFVLPQDRNVAGREIFLWYKRREAEKEEEKNCKDIGRK